MANNRFSLNDTYLVYADTKEQAIAALTQFAKHHKNGDEEIDVTKNFREHGSIGLSIMNPIDAMISFAKWTDTCVKYFPNSNFASVNFRFDIDEKNATTEDIIMSKEVEKVYDRQTNEFVACEIRYITHEKRVETIKPHRTKEEYKEDIQCLWFGCFDLDNFAEENIPSEDN